MYYDDHYYPWGPITCPKCETLSMFEVFHEMCFTDGYFIALACCPKCRQLVILESENKDGKNPSIVKYPIAPNPPAFNKKIIQLSPRFIKIYKQAFICESLDLDEIAGMGYRKAIEILIKDFLIYRFPGEKESIIKMPLSACINQKVNVDNIKIVASRGAWLGNDYTHYQAKFEDKDLSDMKSLIETTVYWILMELNTDNAKDIKPR